MSNESHEPSDPVSAEADVNAVADARRESYKRVAQREAAEPEELQNPVPRPVAFFAIALICWGAWYYFDSAGYPVGAGDRRTPIVVDPAAEIDGGAVYAANCVSCHQASGGGLAGVFPPLAESPWVVGSDARLVQILLYGINGPIDVLGTTYNGVMPAFGHLPDGEIAAVLTHIRSNWGNDAAAITAADVFEGRERDPQRQAPWGGGEELDAVFPPGSQAR